jgi:DnaJ-class molecular chaperone
MDDYGFDAFDPDRDCFRCVGSGIILTGSWGQRAENCPDCDGTGQQEQAR